MTRPGEPLVIRPDDTEEAIKKRLHSTTTCEAAIVHYGAKVATSRDGVDVIYPVMKVVAHPKVSSSRFPPPTRRARPFPKVRRHHDVGQIRHRVPARVLGASTPPNDASRAQHNLFAVLGHEHLTRAIVQRDGLRPIHAAPEHTFRDHVFHKTLDRPSQWPRAEAASAAPAWMISSFNPSDALSSNPPSRHGHNLPQHRLEHVA